MKKMRKMNSHMKEEKRVESSRITVQERQKNCQKGRELEVGRQRYRKCKKNIEMKRARNIGTDSDKIVEKIRSKID